MPPVRPGRHHAGGRGLARGTLGITAIAVAVAVARSPGWSALQWVLAMGVAFESWTAAAALYAGVLAAAALVELAPREVTQPVAFAAFGAGLFLACGAGWPIGLEWFAPVYLLKLVGAYAVPPERG